MIARRHRILQSLALFGLFSILPMFLQAELTVGMEGAIEISCEHELLEAKAVDHRADVIIRIANIEERKGRFVYDLRYIVNRPGSYDLRDFLVRSDGAPLQGLQPIPVSVSGLLPAESKGDLEETFLPPLPRLGGYRLAFSLGLVLWLVPIVFIAVRSLREKKTQEEVAD
ncbi:MAG: hypothetical protein QF886_24935, partial [Planctomycetota bacterium]|nr:hypothetical protein [Planctomycetota bacterium]